MKRNSHVQLRSLPLLAALALVPSCGVDESFHNGWGAPGNGTFEDCTGQVWQEHPAPISGFCPAGSQTVVRELVGVECWRKTYKDGYEILRERVPDGLIYQSLQECR